MTEKAEPENNQKGVMRREGYVWELLHKESLKQQKKGLISKDEWEEVV